MKNIRMIAVALCAMPLLHSCVDEDVVDRKTAISSTSIKYDLTELENLTSETRFNVQTCKAYVQKYRLVHDKTKGDSLITPKADSLNRGWRSDFHFGLGEFKSVAFNYSSSAFDLATLRTKMQNPTYELLDTVSVGMMKYTSSSSKIGKPKRGFKDYNVYKNPDSLYAGFVVSAGTAFVTGVSELVALEQNQNKVVKFEAKKLTHDLKVTFNFDKAVVGEEGSSTTNIKVDSVYCVLSGVPQYFNFLTGALNTDYTNKIIFKAYLGSEDKYEATKVTGTATLHVPSLISSNSKSALTGPGVMQFIIYTHYINKDKVVAKTAYAVCNISKSLDVASLNYKLKNGIFRKPGNVGLEVNISGALNVSSLVKGGLMTWKDK